MDVNPLQVFAGIILVFFLPGYLMVKALFPGRNELDKEYNVIYEIGLGMGLSIVIVILDGFLLGSLHQVLGFRTVGGVEKGWFDAPYIWASLLLICLLLFITAWYRGAFPWMGRLHPKLARVPASEKPQARKKRMDAQILRLWELSREREKLRRDGRDSERRSRARGLEMNQYYKKKLAESREKLKKVDEDMKKIEDERADELSAIDEMNLQKRLEKERRRQEKKPLFGGKDGKKEDEKPSDEKKEELKPAGSEKTDDKKPADEKDVDQKSGDASKAEEKEPADAEKRDDASKKAAEPAKDAQKPELPSDGTSDENKED